MRLTIASIMVILSMIVTAWAIAGDFSSGDYQRQNTQNKRQRPMHVGMLLGKSIHDSMVATVLSDLSGQDVSTQDLGQGMGMRELLESTGIGQETFRTAMDEQYLELAAQAVQCGIITEAQADEIAEQLANRPARPQGQGGGSQSQDGQDRRRPTTY